MPTNEKIEQLASDLFHLMPLYKKNISRPFREFLTDLSPMQVHVLLLLKDKQPISMSELADKMNISRQQLTFLTKKLEDNSYIHRIHDKHDRRSVKISITIAGIDFLKEHRTKSLALIIKKLGQLSSEDINELHKAIETFNKILSKL